MQSHLSLWTSSSSDTEKENEDKSLSLQSLLHKDTHVDFMDKRSLLMNISVHPIHLSVMEL